MGVLTGARDGTLARVHLASLSREMLSLSVCSEMGFETRTELEDPRINKSECDVARRETPRVKLRQSRSSAQRRQLMYGMLCTIGSRLFNHPGSQAVSPLITSSCSIVFAGCV
jgi:hypothetical protein